MFASALSLAMPGTLSILLLPHRRIVLDVLTSLLKHTDHKSHLRFASL